MPVIPYPTPPVDPPAVDVPAELAINRAITHEFILADPYTVVLVGRVGVRTPAGGVEFTEAVRNAQIMRLIPMSHTERPSQGFGTSVSGGGVQRKFDFTLLGEWDAIIGKNDYWIDVDGQKWVVDSLLPFNGYQQKAMIMSYGEQAKRQ